MKTRFLLSAALMALACFSQAQNAFWNVSNQKPDFKSGSDWNKLEHVQFFQLNHAAFRDFLIKHVGLESSNNHATPVQLPFPDGSLHTFYVQESPVMEQGLADKYPEIKTYKGSDGSHYMRMSISPYSFQAYILTEQGDVVIEAYDRNNLNGYGVFFSSDLRLNDPVQLSCGTKDITEVKTPVDPQVQQKMQSRTGGILGTPVELRTYRLALTCTGDWGGRGDLGGGTLALALDKMVASLSLINAVYEKDVAVHLNLITGNDRLIYLDGNADPYPQPTVGGATLGINTSIINAKIPRSAYDIGHIYTIGCSDVGGIAYLGCVCNDNKGGGVTCWYTSDIAYVSQRITCHEMGHQFNASHTFSNCNGNESGTSYEPGSGTTIMSYSGLCGAGLNVEPGNGPHPNYFHVNSVNRIYDFTRNDIGSCGSSTPTNNTFPVPEILFPSGLYIPIRTPFKLTGRATDMENDAMTYNWEQYDAGGYGPMLGEPSLTEEGPLFKSIFPNNNPVRIVPVWNTILTKANFERTEVLPTVDRQITFRFTARDNHPGAGGTAWKQIGFRALESAGPFAVVFPNESTLDTLFTDLCNKITWDVANTDKSLVNCKKVNVYLMPNRTNPDNLIPLALNTENDGEELVTIPDSLNGSSRARILVEAVGNIFFDVSDQDIRIRSSVSPKLLFGVAPSSLRVCVPTKTDIQIQSCAAKITGNMQVYVESGLPDNASYRFDQNAFDVNGSNVLHLDFTNVVTSGINTLVITAITPNGDTLRESIELDLVSVDYSSVKTVYPADGLSGLAQSIEFKWNPSINAESYNLEIATSPVFGNTIVYTLKGIKGSTFKPNFFFEENKLYYWRIIPVNRCGEGGPTTPAAFHTINKACIETDYIGNVISLKSNRTGSMMLTIPNAGFISDVNVKNFEATAVGINSVSLTLVSPSGTKVKLFDKNCGVTSNFDCSFDDDASVTLLAGGCPPIQGKLIQPLESLSKFIGENKKGDWRIELATDNFLSGFAEFNNFKLDICSDLIVNNPFNLNNLGLYMNAGETKGIGLDLLQSQDIDNTADQLVYTIVAKTQRGDLLLSGQVLDYGSKFTQKDIDDGKLSYHHTGSDMEIDGFLFTVEDGAGGWYGTDYFKIQIGAVATDDQTQDPGLEVYPNPTQGQLQISTNEIMDKSARLRLINLQGQVILHRSMANSKAEQINIQNLADGIYILEIKSEKYFAAKKVVLKK